MSKQKGLTVIELIIALAIMLIVIKMGTSSLKAMALRQYMTTNVNQLISIQRMARQLAMSHKAPVTMCPTINGEHCVSQINWQQGILVFVDRDGDRIIDRNDKLIKFYKPQHKKIQITWRAAARKRYLQFLANGWTATINGTFRLCFEDESLHYNRAIIVSMSGRTRLSEDRNDDGIHEDASGTKITC